MVAEWLLIQFYLSLAGAAAGLLLAVFYNLYRILQNRKGERRHPRSYWRGDLLFGFATTVLVTVLWFVLTDGMITFSAVLVLWGSFMLFNHLMNRPVQRMYDKALLRKQQKAAEREQERLRRQEREERLNRWKKPQQAEEKRQPQEPRVPRSQLLAEKSVLGIMHGSDKAKRWMQQKRRKKQQKEEAEEGM